MRDHNGKGKDEVVMEVNVKGKDVKKEYGGKL